MFLRPHSLKQCIQFSGCLNNLNFSSNIKFKMCKNSVLTGNTFRQAHSGPLTAELFSETQYAHRLLTNTPHKYSIAKDDEIITSVDDSQSTFTDKLLSEWESKTPDAILESFKWFSNYAFTEGIDISSNIFDDFIDALADNINNFNDEQLKIVLSNLSKWPKSSLKTRNFIELSTALDDVLLSRASEWDVDKLLLFLDYVYKLNLIKYTDFPTNALNRVTKRAKYLTDAQLIQGLFYIGTNRVTPHEIHKLEVRLKDSVDSLTIDELAILSTGFYKSLTPLRDPSLVDNLTLRIISEAEYINEHNLRIILTLLRISYGVPSLELMLNTLTKQIPRLSLLTCVNIAMIGVKSTFYHRELLAAIAQKLIDNPSVARIKDLERLLIAFSSFSFHLQTGEILLDTIVNELRSPKNLEKVNLYGMSLINCLYYLAIMGKFPQDLISRTLDKDFLKECYGNNYMYGYQALSIDVSVEIECVDYEGNRMQELRRERTARLYSEYIPEAGNKYKLNFTEKMLLEIMQLIAKMRGKKFVYTGYLLPHFQRGDVVICNDPSGNPVKVERCFPHKHKFGSILRAPDCKNTWVALVVTGKRCLSSNTAELLGATLMKQRQLKKIGYSPVLVSYLEWNELETEEQKIKYLKDKVKSVNVDL